MFWPYLNMQNPIHLMFVGSTVIIILDYDFGLNECMRAVGGGQALIHNAFVNIGRGQLVTEYESITVIILQTPSTYHFNATPLHSAAHYRGFG